MTTTKPETIEEYIAAFPANIQNLLEQIRETIKSVAPEAEETIKYAMPTFTINGNLIHFAAFKHHIGLYPTPDGVDAFRDELAAYKGAKGSVQFSLDQPMPLDLIARIVKFRVGQNLAKPPKKASKKP